MELNIGVKIIKIVSEGFCFGFRIVQFRVCEVWNYYKSVMRFFFFVSYVDFLNKFFFCVGLRECMLEMFLVVRKRKFNWQCFKFKGIYYLRYKNFSFTVGFVVL